MKKREKNTSTMVATTLLLGAIFIVAVIYQHSTEPTNLEPTLTTGLEEVNPLVQVNHDWDSYPEPELEEIVEEVVEIIEPETDIRFTDAFHQARESLGPGHTFEWKGNLYTTNRADDSLDINLESPTYALDSTQQETTSAINIEIAP